MNRQTRRAMGKGLGEAVKGLQGLGETAKGLSDLGEKLSAAEGLVAELAGLRDALRTGLATTAAFEYELAKQRAVFLRFLWNPSIGRVYPRDDMVETCGIGDAVADFLAVEQHYRDEYDAMRFLVGLLTFVGQGGPCAR